MTTYKEIKGTNIEVLASDPSNPVEGQVWYNSTDNVLKGAAQTAAGSWASGGNLNTARWIYTHGAGTQTASLVYGGENGPGAVTEAYNGTSWTEVNDLNTAGKAMGGGGAYTSALTAGGSGRLTNSESWNGTSWSNTPSLNTGREYLAAGNQSGTAGVVFGGLIPPGFTNARAETESYNGSSWTEVADLNTARRSVAGTGTSTLALCGGGYVTGNVANVETWNGSSWTEVADQNIAGGGAMFGIQSSAVKKSGVNTELWNGTSWSTGTSSSDNISNRSGLGTSSLGLLAGGESPYSTATEEYLGAGVPLVQTFTDS